MSVYGLSSPSRQRHKQRLDLTFAQSAFVSQKETLLLLAIIKKNETLTQFHMSLVSDPRCCCVHL